MAFALDQIIKSKSEAFIGSAIRNENGPRSRSMLLREKRYTLVACKSSSHWHKARGDGDRVPRPSEVAGKSRLHWREASGHRQSTSPTRRPIQRKYRITVCQFYIIKISSSSMSRSYRDLQNAASVNVCRSAFAKRCTPSTFVTSVSARAPNAVR